MASPTSNNAQPSQEPDGSSLGTSTLLNMGAVASVGKPSAGQIVSQLSGEAVVARQDEIPWTNPDFRGVAQVFGDSRETPLDVPLHPGVERFLRDNRGKL